MEIICEYCKAKLNVPPERIPQGQMMIIDCPRCKNKLALEDQAPQGNGVDSASGRKIIQKASAAGTDYGYGDVDFSLDFYEGGLKLALVMDNEITGPEKLRSAVEKLGYRYVVAENTKEAIGKMRFHHFDLIILSDGFDGIGLEKSPVLQYLNQLPMSIRRNIFLALIGDSFNTRDLMIAFSMSANLVINRGDLDNVTAILSHGISENEKFYKVFSDTLVELSKV